MTTLTEKIWRGFLISDLFHVKIGKAIDGNKVDRTSGHYPYVTRKESNNGVDGFIDYDESFLNKDVPCITVGNETAQPFVQKVPFFTGTKVNILSPKKKISYLTLQFIATSLKMHKSKYSYAFTINSTRLKNQKIMLPVNDKGEPDYNFMENYVRVVEEKQLQRYRDYVQALDAAKIPPLNEKIWRPFFISDLFRLETGKSKGLNHLEDDEQGISYLGATNRNNGVLTFVKPVENLIQRGNCIAFIRNGEGSIGYSIYKREDFIATSDITCGYADFLNEFVGLFITTVADKVRGKYNFNYKRSDTRLKREKLMLPINDDGAPDFEYMEAYVKNSMAAQYRKYLEYLGDD